MTVSETNMSPASTSGASKSGASMTLELTLRSAEELFAEPEADPFNPYTRFQSGIEELMARVRMHPRQLGRSKRLVIRLPQSEIHAGTEEAIRAALDRYCAAHIAINQQVIGDLRMFSRSYTLSGIAICLALVVVAGVLLIVLPQRFDAAIAGFTGVAIWVILWDPLWNYFYAWRPNWRDIQALNSLRSSEVVVQAT